MTLEALEEDQPFRPLSISAPSRSLPSLESERMGQIVQAQEWAAAR